MLAFANILWFCPLLCPDIPLTGELLNASETVQIESIDIDSGNRESSFFTKRRNQIGSAYTSATRAVDSFISGPDFEDISDEKSYLKLELGNTFYSDGRTDDHTQLRFRAHLPNSEKRLRIFFDSDLEEDNSIERTVRSVSQGQQIREDSSTAGIELKRKSSAMKLLRPSLSLGARFNSGLRSFVRLRVRNRETHFAKHWSFKVRQDLWHLGAQGWGAGNRIEIKRQKKNASKFTFFSITNTDYKHYLDEAELAQRWIVSDRKSDTFSIEYQLGHIADSSIRSGFTRHFVSTSFLKQIYENWIFISLTPEIAYRFDEEWLTEESITVKFDLFFTD